MFVCRIVSQTALSYFLGIVYFSFSVHRVVLCMFWLHLVCYYGDVTHLSY